jgi:hypothetical protein
MLLIIIIHILCVNKLLCEIIHVLMYVFAEMLRMRPVNQLPNKVNKHQNKILALVWRYIFLLNYFSEIILGRYSIVFHKTMEMIHGRLGNTCYIFYFR